MAEVVEETVAEVPASQPTDVKAVRKEKVKRLEKPDRGILDEQISKLQNQVDTCQARIQEIKVIIENKKEGRKQIGSGGQLARTRMAELRAQFKAALDEKNAIREELNASDAARDALRNETKAIKDKLSFVRIEQIDEEINKLERKISHTTMALDEERKTLDNIKQLRKSREMVKAYNERLERLQEDDSIRRSIVDRMKSKDLAINEIKAMENQQRAILEEIRMKEDQEVSSIPALANERNESYEIVREAKEAIRQLRTEFKAREDEYYQRERECRAQIREEKQARWELAQAERKEREARRKAYERENAPDPFDDEIRACEQLIGYLSKYVSSPEVVEVASTSSKDFKDFEGMVTVASRRDVDEVADGQLAGLVGGLGAGKKGKKAKKNAKKDSKPELLSHGLDSLGNFALLKIRAPLTQADCAGSMEEVKEKKAYWEEKRVEEKARREREPEVAEVTENGDGLDADADTAEKTDAEEPAADELEEGELVEDTPTAEEEKEEEAVEEEATEAVEEEAAEVVEGSTEVASGVVEDVIVAVEMKVGEGEETIGVTLKSGE